MARRSGILTLIIRETARAQRRAETERKRQLHAQLQAAREADRIAQRQAREQERQSQQQAREWQRRQVLSEREAHQLQRETEKEMRRQQQETEKEAQQQYLKDQLEEAEAQTKELNERIGELKNILAHTLTVNDAISFQSLRIEPTYPLFSPPSDLTTPRRMPQPLPPPMPPPPKETPRYLEPQKESFFSGIKPPSWIERKLFAGAARYDRALKEAEERYEAELLLYKDAAQEVEDRYLAAVTSYQREIREAELLYQAALKNHEEEEAQRKEKLEKLKTEYERNKQAAFLKAQQRNQEVDELEAAYRAGDQDALLTYNTMVLERSKYPEGFPQEFRLAYVPESKELVIEYELPTSEIIPPAAEVRYIKARDIFEEKPRKPAEIKELYQDIVAAVALRTIHEVLEADQSEHVEVAVFNGFVQTVDLATGKDIQPHLISARATKESFAEINLARVDKKVCLRNLGAQVSPQPSELLAVKPIVDFNMVDKRFVEGNAIIDELDGRENLMDLNPFQFEQLVCDLFAKNGLETKLTRSSRDGGVDAVAFDKRPVLGGKVVIQAKRYRNTVGVSAVRDLYGTMMNEGADKGILVTTSGYGPDAFEFVLGKPIELIDGGGLLYLLEQVGKKARIMFPAEG